MESKRLKKFFENHTSDLNLSKCSQKQQAEKEIFFSMPNDFSLLIMIIHILCYIKMPN